MIFHKAIGFPSNFTTPTATVPTVLSAHARERAAEKGFVIPAMLNLSAFDVVEIEIRNGRVVKYVVRGEYDNYDDIVIVFIPQGRNAFVKTAWLNAWDDKHKSLDVSKYAKPGK